MVFIAAQTHLRTLAFLIAIMTAFAALPASGERIDISFRLMLDDTGPGDIRVITQDQYGYIWLGGRNAILKYNAYEYVPVQYWGEKNGKIQKSNPYYTTDIFEDRSGTVWITSHSGLFRYDRDRDQLVKPNPVNDQATPLFSNPLQDIDQLPSGELIIGGDGIGFIIYDAQANRIVWLQNEANAGSEIEAESGETTIQQFLVDSENRVWYSNNRGLNLFDVQSKQAELFVPNPDNPNSKADNALTSLLEDRQGNILGGTIGKGLYLFNPDTQTFTHFVHDPNNPKSIAEDTVWNLVEDHNGTVWVAHDRSNFSWFDPEQRQFQAYRGTAGRPGSLAFNAVRSIFEDRNGDIWIGHYPGKVSFHDRSTAAIRLYENDPQDPKSLGENNVLAVMEDDKGNFWLAAGSSVEYFDRQSHQFKHYNAENKTYPAHGTLSGFIDSRGQVYIGTWTEGYHKYNPQQDRFEAQPVNSSLANSDERLSESLSDATIWSFCETRDGALWLGTHYAGISRFHEPTQTFKKFKAGNAPYSITNNIAWNCHEDSQGRFWIGTAWGVSLLDYNNDVAKNYRPAEGEAGALQAGSVLATFEDTQGRLWFGTNGGLHHYNESTDSFTVFTTDHGLSHNGVRAITQDAEGQLWLGTDSGITRFDPDTHAAKSYLTHNGIAFGSVNTGAALTSQKGEIVFGTVNGLVVINPAQLSTNTTLPSIVLSEFKLFAKTVPINGPNQLLKKTINQTEHIELDHTQRMISFEFAALSYRAPEKNLYAYKLDGFDQQWREVEHQREAQYTNLSPGRYTFMVKASNNDGVWNEQPKTITIIQHPPPWKTWWAYSLYASMLLFALVYFVQHQRRKRQQVEIQNRILEAKVAERTATLAEKNRNIQSMLSNMRQGLFTIDSDLTIHPEYSAYLENIYERQDIAGHDAIHFMFDNAQLSNDRRHQIEASVHSIIGMDTMNYEFNAHLLAKEYRTEINEHIKVLALDWDPIVDDDTVIKLMVSVRDVTDLKLLEFEAAEKKRDLEIIGQLLNIKSSKYLNFHRSAQQYAAQCQSILDNEITDSQEAIQKLFRHMHTIKGNSRTLTFNYIADAAHDAESRYSAILAGDAEWERMQVKADLEKVQKMIDLYHHLYSSVLGRDNNDRGVEGAWFDNKSLKTLLALSQRIQSNDPETYHSIEEIIHEKTTVSLVDLLNDNITALTSIAAELHKPIPRVVIEDHSLRVTSKAQSLLVDVFSHLLRNSIDHGIETAEQRAHANKPSSGKITVCAARQQDTIAITLTDDGGGLDLNALYNKGLKSRLWRTSETVTFGQIADSIFHSGTTTKQAISHISGRGVGLDAVKQTIEEFGGEITIESPELDTLFNPNCPQSKLPFHFCIRLPSSLFR